MSDVIQILIVEDSRTQAHRLRYILEHEGYLVTVAGNGIEALAALGRSLPAIIISDIMMPEMDGFELCRRIKADERLKGIPVVLLTALSETEDVFKAMQAGADNFITKSYGNQSLLSNLRRILSNIELRNREGVESSLEVYFEGQKYTLDISRHRMVDFLLSTYENALQKNNELDQKNQQLKEALDNNKVLQANYRRLLETNLDAVVVIDSRGVIRYANPAANALQTDGVRMLEGSTLPFSVKPGDRKEIALTRSDGDLVIAEMRVVETGWNGETVSLAVFRDMTEQVRMREELRQISLHDQLTGLYNRRGFFLISEQLLRLAEREHRQLFVMYIDLDGMKRINDMLGHQEGDAALCDIAEIMRSTFRTSDIIGRLGGDEFAVLGFCDNDPTLEVLETRFSENIAAHNASGIRAFTLSASIGIQVYLPNEPSDLILLLEKADALMYEHKKTKQATKV